MKQKFTCDICDAFGSITISNKDEDYEILVCPSCGSELDSKSDTDEDDE